MTFASAAFLWGTLLAAVPVIIHLAGRRRARTVRFPSLRLLVQVNRALARRHKIRELLLLALRAAAVCLVAIGLAQPRLVGSAGMGAGERRTSTAIVIDNSLSMRARSGGVSLLERAAQVAVRWIEALGPEERVAIVPLFGAGTAPTSDHRAQAEEAARVEPTHLSARLDGAIARAAKLLEGEPSPVKRIVVVSDFALSTPPARFAPPDGVQVIAVRAPAPDGPNLAARSVEPLPGRSSEIEIRIGVVNGGAGAARGELALDAGGAAMGRRAILVPAGVALDERFPATAIASTLLRARIACGDDVLAEDNERFAVVPRIARIRALLVKERESAAEFLDESFWLGCALAVPSGNIALSTARVAELAGFSLDRFEAIFLAGIRRIEGPLAEQLYAFVRGGGTLVLVAGEAMDCAAWRARAEEAFSVVPVVVRDFVALRECAIGAVDEAHPLARALRELSPPPDLRGATFRRVVRVDEPQAPARAIMTLENGLPLLVEARRGEGRIYFFAAALTPDWSALPLRVAFVPLVHALLRVSAASRPVPLALDCGEELVLPPRFAGAAIAGPAGPVVPSPRGDGVATGPLAVPGHYVVTLREERYETAVNVPAAESALASLSDAAIASTIGAAAVIPLDDPRRVVEEAQAAVGGRGLSAWFLRLFLIVICLEGILAGLWSHRRR